MSTPKVGKHHVGDTVDLGDWGTVTLKPGDFAVMYLRDGRIADVAYGWETAESMTLEGYLVSVVAEYPDAAEWQRRMDASAAEYADCWGEAMRGWSQVQA